MNPDYKIRPGAEWGTLKAGDVFKWNGVWYTCKLTGSEYVGVPESFVLSNPDTFEMVNPLKEKKEILLSEWEVLRLLRGQKVDFDNIVLVMKIK